MRAIKLADAFEAARGVRKGAFLVPTGERVLKQCLNNVADCSQQCYCEARFLQEIRRLLAGLRLCSRPEF